MKFREVVNQTVTETLERLHLKLGVDLSSRDPQELESIVLCLALVVVGLEANLKQALPEPERHNVRAFIDQLSHQLASSPTTPTAAPEGQGIVSP